MKIGEECRHKTDSIVRNKLINFGPKSNAEDILKWLESISIALLIQKDHCTNAEAVHTWKNLEIELNGVHKSL